MSYTKVQKIYYNHNGKLCLYGAANNVRPLYWHELNFDDSQPELLSLYLDLISGCIQIVGNNKTCNSIYGIINEIKELHYTRFTERNKSIDIFGLYMLNCIFLSSYFKCESKSESLKFLLDAANDLNIYESYRKEKMDMYTTYYSRFEELQKYTIDMYELFESRISKFLIKPIVTNVNITIPHSIQISLFK